jgi:hypothetical protein
MDLPFAGELLEALSRIDVRSVQIPQNIGTHALLDRCLQCGTRTQRWLSALRAAGEPALTDSGFRNTLYSRSYYEG